MLPQDICQVHPSRGFGETDDRSLRPCEISTIDAVRVVVVVVPVPIAVIVVVVVVMVVVVSGGFSDATKPVVMEDE